MRKLERRFLLQAGSGSLPSGGKPEADREPAACPSGRRRRGRVRPPVVSSIRPWEVSVCLSVVCVSASLTREQLLIQELAQRPAA